jgi:hypothetical protein
MKTVASGYLFLMAALAVAPTLTACGVQVDKDANGRNANVNVKIPFGNVSVHADADTPPDTGLPVRAGAPGFARRRSRQRQRERRGGPVHGARSGWPDTSTTTRLRRCSSTTARSWPATATCSECRGNLDFKDGTAPPRCKSRSRDEMQLGAGSEQDNHVVSVKPRGSGSEFTLVHVTTSRG